MFYIAYIYITGTSLHVIIGLDIVIAVIVSAAVAVLYTLIGQMVSVAYTDILELIVLAFGLVSLTNCCLFYKFILNKFLLKLAQYSLPCMWKDNSHYEKEVTVIL